MPLRRPHEYARMSYECKNNQGGATTRYSRGLSRSMPISGDHPRFVQNSDALTNVLRMYHGLSRFLKSWTIGTKDRDSVTDAYTLWYITSSTYKRCKTPVTLVPEWTGMLSEWRFVVHSLIIELHLKHSDCVLCAFRIFCHILTGRNVLHMFKTFVVHSKGRNIERHWKCILTALWLLSKYSYSIPTAFHTFWSHSRENWNGNTLRILSECPECVSNEPECTLNAYRLLPESNKRIQLECTSNAVGNWR